MNSPLTPDEVIPPRAGEVDAGIKRINQALKTRWSDRERIEGRYVVAGLLGPETKTVIAAFQDAGWSVEFTEENQRSGALFLFKKKEE